MSHLNVTEIKKKKHDNHKCKEEIIKKTEIMPNRKYNQRNSNGQTDKNDEFITRGMVQYVCTM